LGLRDLDAKKGNAWHFGYKVQMNMVLHAGKSDLGYLRDKFESFPHGFPTLANRVIFLCHYAMLP
jgi:hypothetical protein